MDQQNNRRTDGPTKGIVESRSAQLKTLPYRAHENNFKLVYLSWQPQWWGLIFRFTKVQSKDKKKR